MPSSRIAIFPGSFDPLTNGHLDVIRRTARLFDRVIVAVLVNSEKRVVFTVDERVAMINESCAGIGQPGQVTADAFEGLLVHYAKRRGACAVVRGLRSGIDFDYERPMALMNAHLAPEIETVCVIGADRLAHISSRLVKEVVGLGGSVEGLLPDSIARRLVARLRAGKSAV